MEALEALTYQQRLERRNEAIDYVAGELPGSLWHALHETIFYGPKRGLTMLASLVIADYEAYFHIYAQDQLLKVQENKYGKV